MRIGFFGADPELKFWIKMWIMWKVWTKWGKKEIMFP